jgi:hypothetical protein
VWEFVGGLAKAQTGGGNGSEEGFLKDVATELGVHRDGELISAALRWLVLDACWFMSAPVDPYYPFLTRRTYRIL